MKGTTLILTVIYILASRASHLAAQYLIKTGYLKGTNPKT